ncbi:hypothetical protein LDENG_00230760 [Lucifuga dentata]|nr:hypothetical protein LDENG_00230760 [Lucifuga dentata]
MELVWEDPPVPKGPFFTRDSYDKYSLAPNIRELWFFLQSPTENFNKKQEREGGVKPSCCSPSTNGAAENKDNSYNNEKETCWDSYDSDHHSAESADDCKNTKNTKVKHKWGQNMPDAPYPEPRMPFPCMSSLSSKDQKAYLGILMGKKPMNPPQNLIARVNNEVMQFTKYLQDVSKICAEDYNFTPPGALQYSEDFFRGCLECIKMLPQLYQIHEMTSLTGGTFNPGLTLAFEKQLLVMGNVDITDHNIVPADVQLALDYHSVSSENPPAKKAKDKHATLSGDSNAEKLCAHYEPHVCVTRDALVTLLDNHGPEFGDQWELPVWVKLKSGKGSNQRKTVYIDSPLLKTEVTLRERSHIYHEESLKLSIKKTGSKHVFHLMTEVPAAERQLPPESSQRNLVSFETNGLDFDVDLTDLETFGEAGLRKPKIQNEQDACDKSKKKAVNSPTREMMRSNTCLAFNTSSSSSPKKTNASLTGMDNPVKEDINEVAVTEQLKQDYDQKSEEESFPGDSEDDRLVIDDLKVSPATTPPQPKTTSHSTDPLITPAPESVPLSPPSSSPPKVKGPRRKSKRIKNSGDQLGEILRMQTAMLKDASKHVTSQEISSPSQSMGPSVHSHPASLVKPCVSSYLESNQKHDGETEASPHKGPPSLVNVMTAEHKKILSQDLQASAEDEQDYEAPLEGNLLYKLYSLQELLLMVRSSVSLTHTRRTDSTPNKHVPVHVLPKLEYQLSYGVECLSSSEACRLWTETVLHSSTVSYVAHINAHTSKVALLRKLPEDWKQNISCGFKPSKSLNILHHLLKKLNGLEEGRYLIGHKAGEPFVKILKAADGNLSRGAYNLQQVHSSVPLPPASALVPWIPVDPAVVLPFHQKHSRVPCTFPPRPFVQTPKDGTSHYKSYGAMKTRQSKAYFNAGGNIKKKKGKRAAGRDKYMKKIIQKSISSPISYT